MKIAFYAPLKSPRHPVPSGDRLMARLLIEALELAGHEVALASDLRAFLRDAEDRVAYAALTQAAEAEQARLAADWAAGGKPDLWFSYHGYYKSPDLIGPPLCRAHGIPLVTIESSLSARRDIGLWAETQAMVRAAVTEARLNLCLTRRDRDGLAEAVPQARLALVAPFLAAEDWLGLTPAPRPHRLITVAMMRHGDKLQSFGHLARALALLPPELPWSLSVIGDGPARAEVEASFAAIQPGRLLWHGQRDPAFIAEELGSAALYCWPGCGEAYGLAYLEAQAAGVPVVAFATAGVPEVVASGETGLLTPDRDDRAYAAAIATLLADEPRRAAMGRAARARVTARHTLAVAARRLADLLRPLQEGPAG